MQTTPTNHEDVLEACAHAAHETCRAYFRALGEDDPPWGNVSPIERAKKRAIAQHVLNGDDGAALHRRWVDKMRAAGWTYGPDDDQAKTHSFLQPYDDLDPRVRRRDVLYVTVIRGMAAAFDSSAQDEAASAERATS
jgi:hypothetical protein